MKIGNLTDSIQATGSKPVKASNGNDAPAGLASDKPVSEVDKVALSSASQVLVRSGAAGLPTDSFDANKVIALQKSIADGSYKIDPQAIARKMIADQIDLLGASQKST